LRARCPQPSETRAGYWRVGFSEGDSLAAQYLDCRFLDIKAAADGRTFSGYGAVFGNTDLGGDIVVPGAFRKSLAEHEQAGTMPALFWMHQPDKVPGKWTSMSEDAKGLHVTGEFVNTVLGNETRELLKAKAINGLSIGYKTIEADYNRDGERLLKELDLWEVSVVSMPMNPQARVTAVKLAEIAAVVQTISDYERLGRDAYGLSRSVAKRFAAKTWPHFREAVHGEPAGTSLETIRDELESATVLSVLHAAAAKIRRL
jgi:uncharacterized protein